MNIYPSRQLDQYVLRLPDGWRDTIKSEAKKNYRPMNGEILAAIEAYFRVRGVFLAPTSNNEKDRQGGNPDGLVQSHLSERI